MEPPHHLPFDPIPLHDAVNRDGLWFVPHHVRDPAGKLQAFEAFFQGPSRRGHDELSPFVFDTLAVKEEAE